MKRIFRRKTTKINSKKVKDLKVDLNKIGAGVQLEEAVEDGEDEASGSGISTESYDDGAKKNN